MRPQVLLLILLATPLLAGCASQGSAESIDPVTSSTTPFASPSARFQVAALSIAPVDDPERTVLREEDEAAVVRYVIRQPADAPRESAFVTYLFNGRIVDVQQLTLEPGAEKTFERKVPDLRATPDIKVEVRAGSSSGRAESSVQFWPRAGADTLTLGPVTVRADYGLLQQDRRALVNLTLAHDGSAVRFEDFRMKMVCIDQEGQIVTTASADIEAPGAGNTTGVDVIVDDCRFERYGMEFRATGDEETLVGRLLLVPRGWAPAAPSPQA